MALTADLASCAVASREARTTARAATEAGGWGAPPPNRLLAGRGRLVPAAVLLGAVEVDDRTSRNVGLLGGVPLLQLAAFHDVGVPGAVEMETDAGQQHRRRHVDAPQRQLEVGAGDAAGQLASDGQRLHH